MLQVKITQPKQTAVYLDNKDIELFKKFRQYQNDFEFLLEGKFFDFKNGSAIINRDSDGVLKNIEIKTITFIRKKGGLTSELK